MADGSGSGRPEVSQLPRNPDLLEGADAVRLEPDENPNPEDRVRRSGGGVLRFCAGVSVAGGARGGVVRHGADAAAGPAPSALYVKGGAQLRSRRGGPGRGRQILRNAGGRRV